MNNQEAIQNLKELDMLCAEHLDGYKERHLGAIEYAINILQGKDASEKAIQILREMSIETIEGNLGKRPLDAMREVFIKHKWEELAMEFEIFVGPNGLKYYVYDSGNWNEIERELCRRTKVKRGTYKCVTVWIIRGEEETEETITDNLYLTKRPGAERKLAAVRA